MPNQPWHQDTVAAMGVPKNPYKDKGLEEAPEDNSPSSTNPHAGVIDDRDYDGPSDYSKA